MLAAVEKALARKTRTDLFSEEERAAIDAAINELLVVQNSDDHNLIRDKIDGVDQATQKLAEAIINLSRGAGS